MSLSSEALITLTEAKNYIRMNAAASLNIPAEYVGMGDGETVEFTLDNTPLDGTLKLYVNGTEATNYTIDGVTITFATAPVLNSPITASYDKAASDNTFESYDDDLLENLINAATKRIEDYTGRAFIQRTITEYQYGDGSEWLRLRKTPVQSVTSVALGDTLLNAGSDYLDYSRIGRLKRSAWDYGELITIVYVAGYGATRAETQALVPDAVTAVLITVANEYENRLGAKTESITGIGSVAYDTGELPETARNLVSSLRRDLI